MSAPVLSIQGLDKSYGESRVLAGLDLDLAAGKTLGFVGPNGAGKTTCLRCIMGLVFADSGSITVDGIDALRDPVQARLRIGYLPGETSVYRWMTGRDFLRFGLAFHDEVDDDFVQMCLDRFEVPVHRPLRSYSSGQKQMLSLAVALGPVVPLYILDEPEKALDASKRHDLREIISELKRRGRTILVSSHHISELEQFSDEYAFLRDGRVVEQDVIDSTTRALSRRMRVRFDGDTEPTGLPPGTTVTRAERDWLLEVPEGMDPRDVASKIMADRPARLEVGEPTLQEVYESLYVGKALT